MHINYIAVLIAAISNFIIGFLMHGPLLGKLWMKLANVHPTGNEKLLPQMVQNFIVNLIFVYTFAVVYSLASASSMLAGNRIIGGIELAVLIWFGFLSTTTSIEVIWMGKSYKLWLFEVFSSLITCITMGAIIAAL
jgi:hypothetical protein